ncbi:hypothetical protein [Paracoccus aerodenitrificans]|uniref:hypothetical protein n=1 Tax=Paracoccus aerodenitrificans TaxID=3017781 RepID=UPI0022F140FD|nr:hypothetical protein [Paracoccus aerodenitrificans]WBU64450.1 hypothetical protein PAE61_03120 [Paracoccus aerodenitrificans]
MRSLLVLMVFVCLTSAGQAVTLKICNAGQQELFLSTAQMNPDAYSVTYRVSGWSHLEEGNCWINLDPEVPQIDVLVIYPDSAGRWGATAFDASFLDSKISPFSYQTGDLRFCVDLDKSFGRERVSKSDTYCDEGEFLAPYPIRVVGTQGGGTLNITAATFLRHDDTHLLKTAPRPPERGEDERISLIRGPSAEQIAGAELRDLRKRLAVGAAFLGLKGTDITLDKVSLDRCVMTNDEIAYCRYEARAQLSDNELGAIAGLVNMGFMINGYQWSSFVVHKDRWELERKYESCRISETRVNCTWRE